MSIRHGLLALLDQGPRYGYQLRTEFEARTGSTWPLNVGQVYTTLARLERDGLVEPAGEDGEGHQFYAATDAGRAELRAWFDTPVPRTNPPRDELAIKLAMAVTVPGVDVSAVVQGQRRHSIKALQDYTRLKGRALAGEAAADGPATGNDLAWLLVLDQLIFQTEAEIRWLDHCETRLAQQAELLQARAARAARDGAAEPGAPSGKARKAAKAVSAVSAVSAVKGLRRTRG
ncbi:PadR family transcriptional regulator [Streptomyces rubellomurinus]|uniref:PadR family transcriptional regulator n=2 Tax=Streptomyces TaxID=1883 RepID=A0A0F2T559_STRR3|nr:PadR family transcriptional regulator [Streptomyces rubellomurinus]KJS54156.1 PadR family transcriptional regulator [Streptomyces rubellomurinus subsp. indigoferus]KJS58359.1 PadR family transcriptional regulator [Streptomyces rubellomurinus]